MLFSVLFSQKTTSQSFDSQKAAILQYENQNEHARATSNITSTKVLTGRFQLPVQHYSLLLHLIRRGTHRVPASRQPLSIIRVEAGENFSALMKNFNIAVFPWMGTSHHHRPPQTPPPPPRTPAVGGGNIPLADEAWLEHTVAWWNHTGGHAIAENTMQDMRHSANWCYGMIAQKIARGMLLQAAQLLTPFADGIDPWPGVAVFENAVVSCDGNVHNSSYTMRAGGCDLGQPMVFSDHRSQRFRVVATIAQSWGQGYYHFVAENLVRLPLVLHVFEARSDAMLHIHSQTTFSTGLLNLIGIAEHRVVQGVVHADFVLFPEPVPCGNPSSVMLNLLRRTLLLRGQLGHVAKRNTSECNILLLTRQGSRAVQNHDELSLHLSEAFRGCSVRTYTGHESIPTQLLMFQSSDIVIAPHGAGLVNIVACRENTLVLELMVSGNDVNLCYMAMANKLRLRHVVVTVEGATQHGVMRVDVPKIIALLSRMKTVSESYVVGA